MSLSSNTSDLQSPEDLGSLPTKTFFSANARGLNDEDKLEELCIVKVTKVQRLLPTPPSFSKLGPVY